MEYLLIFKAGALPLGPLHQAKENTLRNVKRNVVRVVKGAGGMRKIKRIKNY
jgi:hypothetical protein